MRVLVVDDDASIRELVRTALDEFDVEVAPDGTTALELLAGIVVDVVVLDVMMPGMDGIEVLGRIRSTSRLQDLPVVMLTAKASESDHVRGYRAGADVYITKPFEIDELEETLRRLVAQTPAERVKHRKDELEKAELLRQIEQRFAAS